MSKQIKDPVHGYVELHPAAVAIVDTPQFQRLRDLAQLGGVYYVFAGATGKRFEHSLGVAHLARVFVRQLRDRQPELGLTDVDELCVHLAGLVHDLGHGPFSHLFDNKFIQTIRGEASATSTEEKWSHEHASVAMLDFLIADNNLMPVLAAHGMTRHDVRFVQELILGSPKDAPPGFEWVGADGRDARNRADAVRAVGTDGDSSSRSSDNSSSSSSSSSRNINYSQGSEGGVSVETNEEEQGTPAVCKEFLFDIVANSRNGIDVDKFDYFARDCDNLGIQKTFDAHRLMQNARVLFVEDKGSQSASSSYSSSSQSEREGAETRKGHWRVCFADKEAWNVYELFHTRYSLHKRAYQHRVSTVVEHMFCEVLLKANDHITLQGMQGVPATPKEYRMSECIHNMSAYSKLSDWIVYRIQHSTELKLAEARALLQRIRRRELYCFVGEIIDQSQQSPSHRAIPPSKPKAREKQVMQELLEIANARQGNALADGDVGNDESVEVRADDLLVCVVDISYGKGRKNPVDETHFFTRRSGSHRESVGFITRDRVSLMTPQVFSERFVRVWCRDFDKRSLKVDAVRHTFHEWQRQKLGIHDPGPVTPVSAHRGLAHSRSGSSPGLASPSSRAPLQLPPEPALECADLNLPGGNTAVEHVNGSSLRAGGSRVHTPPPSEATRESRRRRMA